jgi:hypothetical protein
MDMDEYQTVPSVNLRFVPPAQPRDLTSKWFYDNVTEFLPSGLEALRTTSTITGSVTIPADSRVHGWDGTGWTRIGAEGDALKVYLENFSTQVDIDGIYNLTTNPTPDNIGLIVSTDGTEENSILRLTGTVIAGVPHNALDVYIADENPDNLLYPYQYGINKYNEETPIGGVETTIVSYTVLSKFYLSGWSCSGRADGIFSLYIDNICQWRGRNNWCQRNLSETFDLGIPVAAGSIIKIRVIHYELTTIPFNGNIYGKEII